MLARTGRMDSLRRSRPAGRLHASTEFLWGVKPTPFTKFLESEIDQKTGNCVAQLVRTGTMLPKKTRTSGDRGGLIP